MKTQSIILNFSALALLTSAPFATSAFAAATTPSRVDSASLTAFPYNTSGIIWNGTWRGSGTVAQNPKVAVSCAHVTFNNGSWLSGNNWAPAYHSSTHPANSTAGHAFRNYLLWSNYTGGTANTNFYYDFVVHYSYANLAGGAYSGWVWNDSTTAHPLESASTYKLIVGYPGSDSYFMNSTGYFTSAYSSRYWQYMWNPSVKGGGGMSGGGVFTWTDSQWKLAGVHVSGNLDGSIGAGARALDGNAQNLMNSAIATTNNPPAATVRTFSNSSQVYIPDNYAGWTVRDVGTYYQAPTLTGATISYNISHTYIGDLEVMLTAPNGRSLTLRNRAGGSADNIVVYGQDITAPFAGVNPNGNWRMSVRDLAGADAGYLNNVSLTLTSR